MLVFGPGFEHDSRFPWASPLTEATDLEPSARIQASFAGALAALSGNTFYKVKKENDGEMPRITVIVKDP